MKTQAKPKYWTLRGGKPVSMISLRNPVAAVTAALLPGKDELTPEEAEAWKKLGYPKELASFEAYSVSVKAIFTGRALYLKDDVPLMFVLKNERETPSRSVVYFATEVEVRAAFKAVVNGYKTFPITAENYGDYKYKRNETSPARVQKSPYELGVAEEISHEKWKNMIMKYWEMSGKKGRI